MNDEGEAEFGQKRDPGVIDPGAVQHDTVNRAACLEVAVRIGLILVTNDRQQQIIALFGIALAGTGDEIGKDGVHHLVLARHGQQMPDRHGATSGQSRGARIWCIVVKARRFLDALARAFADLGIIVQCATDGCGG